MKKKIAILGSTGSIGKSLINILKSDKKNIEIKLISANININELVDYHESKGKIATLTGVHPPSRYGLVETDGQGEVIQFKEKPRMDEMVSAGFFVFKKDIFDLIPDEDCMLEREPFEFLATERQMTLYHHEGYWQCMDTYRDFIQLNETWSRAAPWKVW